MLAIATGAPMPLRVDQTITAVASCSYCRWQVQHRGPALEVSCFLRGLVIEHVRAQHADAVTREGGFEILDHVAADLSATLMKAPV
jgi:hypothetical protein